MLDQSNLGHAILPGCLTKGDCPIVLKYFGQLRRIVGVPRDNGSYELSAIGVQTVVVGNFDQSVQHVVDRYRPPQTRLLVTALAELFPR
jgi:hypothetical protein